MKKILLLLLLPLTVCCSKDEDVMPTEDPLIGTWVSKRYEGTIDETDEVLVIQPNFTLNINTKYTADYGNSYETNVDVSCVGLWRNISPETNFSSTLQVYSFKKDDCSGVGLDEYLFPSYQEQTIYVTFSNNFKTFEVADEVYNKQ